MPFIPTPNVVQAEIRALFDGQRVENRIFINVFHTPTQADLDAIAGVLFNQVGTNWVPLMPNTWQCTEFFLRSMQTQNDIQATFPQAASGFTGTNGGAALPNNVTMCVSLRSGNAGRSARGRLYWQAIPDTFVQDNTMSVTNAGQITAAVNALRAGIEGLGYKWVIVSYRSGGVVRPGGPVYFVVNTALLVDRVVDSMRRRLPGRGI